MLLLKLLNGFCAFVFVHKTFWGSLSLFAELVVYIKVNVAVFNGTCCQVKANMSCFQNRNHIPPFLCFTTTTRQLTRCWKKKRGERKERTRSNPALFLRQFWRRGKMMSSVVGPEAGGNLPCVEGVSSAFPLLGQNPSPSRVCLGYTGERSVWD